MKLKEKRFHSLLNKISAIIITAEELENKHKVLLKKVHPKYRKSAINLIHYMALRSHNNYDLQKELRTLGLPGLDNVEAHVMRSLLAIKSILNHLLGNNIYAHRKGTISIIKSSKIINSNTRSLFGFKSKKRRTRIMVTMPSTASDDQIFVNDLISSGMNCARINCAHDDENTWKQIINNIKSASSKKKKSVKIMMDLGGPKLRTGAIVAGPQVLHISPEKDAIGNIVNPVKIWLAPADIAAPGKTKSITIPIEEIWLSKIKRDDKISFTDSRGKKCIIDVHGREDAGRWASCSKSAYIVPGTSFTLIKENKHGEKLFNIGELPPIEQTIILNTGDIFKIHKDSYAGEPAEFDNQGNIIKPAHISCTLPEIFQYVKPGEPIMFDDGKIEGKIEEVDDEEIVVRITHAKNNGGKLKSDKGINLPESHMNISGLTTKDKHDLPFVAQYADAVNFSFVNSKEDVQELIDLLEQLNSKIGIILKIETRKGFNNLPAILLTAMQNYPIGVMIARGDLAVETGWKNIANIQEEILRVCEAAHIPDIWATQVLENLAKKGTPSRAEITDAAASQRAECVMLNKGAYIKKTIKLLDKILRQMQSFQDKKEILLSQLDNAKELELTQNY